MAYQLEANPQTRRSESLQASLLEKAAAHLGEMPAGNFDLTIGDQYITGTHEITPTGHTNTLAVHHTGRHGTVVKIATRYWRGKLAGGTYSFQRETENPEEFVAFANNQWAEAGITQLTF